MKRQLCVLILAALGEAKKKQKKERAAHEFFQCRAKQNCGDCIQTSPKCAWCEDLTIPTTDRCFDSSFISNYLNCSSLINPPSQIESSRNRRSAENDHKKHKSKKEKNKKNHKKNGKSKAKAATGAAAGAAGSAVLRGYSAINDRDSAHNPFTPSAMNLQIRPLDEFQFEWTIEMPEYQPLDLYFLFDLSYSMEPDVKNLIAYSEKLFEKFENIYPGREGKKDYFHAGFGSFVDKRLMPASSENDVLLDNPCALDSKDAPSNGQCASNFVFENNLPLAQREGKQFSKDVKSNVKVSSNIDFEEAGLDALIQAAVCAEVGWRNSAQKMIVYISDAGFHTAGDGLLSGLLDRYEESCQLSSNVVKDGDKYDYPSVGQAAKILIEKNIMLALTISVDDDDVDISHVESSYNDLASLIPNSLVEKMSSSKNVDQLANQIYEAYKNLSERAFVDLSVLPTSGYPFKWRIKSTEHFDKNGRPVSHEDCTTECEQVLPGHSVRYTTLVEHVPGAGLGRRVRAPEIRIGVVEERLEVDMQLIEHCECENNDVNAERCENNDLTCGVCDCGEDYTDEECRVDEDKPPCQNVGDCVCGVCHCPDKFSGDFCQCNLQSFCNGGDCVHGQCRETSDSSIESCKMECVCEDGWLKDSVGACRCPPNPESCMGEDGSSCGGELQGTCDCNTCRCNKISDSNNNVLGKWTGEKCANFEDACPEYLKRYVTCRLDFCEAAGDSEGCWEESESECEAEKDPTFKNFNYEGKVLEKYGKLDIDKILPQTYAKIPSCKIAVAKKGDWGSDITCTGNYGIEINEESQSLKLKVHLFDNDKKSFSENLTKCPMDPKKFYTIAGSSLAGLLLLLIALIAILAKCYLNYRYKKEVDQHNKNVADTAHNMTANLLYTEPTSTHTGNTELMPSENDTLLNKSTTSAPIPIPTRRGKSFQPDQSELNETVEAGAPQQAGYNWDNNNEN